MPSADLRMKEFDIDIATRVASDHLAYGSMLTEIEQALGRVLPSKGGRDSLDTLLTLMGDFFRQARRHFALEERGGLYLVYQGHDRISRVHAERMEAQHEDFRERMRWLLQSGRVLDLENVTEFDRFVREVSELTRDLREHERVEDEWLDLLVDRDMGHSPS